MRRMLPLRAGAAVLAGALLLAGCGGAEPPGDAGDIDVQLVADLDEGEARAVGESVNAFGFDLLGEVAQEGENVVTSPVSVSVLLAMILAGAGGDTADAMADVLHLDDSRDVRVGALLRKLADTEDVTLSVANALWAREGTEFEEDYLDVVRNTFGATVDEADLASQEAADEIDEWVQDRTEGRIEEIAADLKLPSSQAVLVLLNAVYFLGQWSVPFNPENTSTEPFTLADGTEVKVPLMQMAEQDFGYAERDGYRMLRLPYGEDGRYAMEVLLPDEDASLGQLLDSLDAAEWQAAVDSLTEATYNEIVLPSFELEWDMELNQPLTDLGMGIAFGGGDFSPMSPVNPFLDVVVHKTYIRVDEEGTEAAAVTGGVMAESAPTDPLVFRVDRPFAFTISDRETGAIMFLGMVADPRG